MRLLGPVALEDGGAGGLEGAQMAEEKWAPQVLGLDKRQLLRHDLLREMAGQPSLQRLVTQIRELLAFAEAPAW